MATEIEAFPDLTMDVSRLRRFRRVVAALCILLVAVPLCWTGGVQEHAAAKAVNAAASGSSGPALSANSSSELVAILALRQVVGVEAKRLLPDPSPPPALVRQEAVPRAVLATERISPPPFGLPHAGLLASNRTPRGPPAA